MGSCISRNKAVAPNKVLPEFGEEKDYLGERGYSRVLKNGDGADLFAYFWPANPDVPLKGIIQLAHGCAAYTCFDYLKFKGPGLPNVYDGSWVEAFNQAGFSVCGIDHQGYGRSKGDRLGCKFQAHVDNLLLLSEDVLENGGDSFLRGLPYFLVAHSMGGLAGTVACIQQPDRFSGLVLLSPLLTMDASAKKSGSLRLGGVKSRPKSDDGEGSTTSERPVPWLHDAWAADPFVRDGGLLSSRQVEELLPPAAQLAADGGMEGVAVPLLIFQSERDSYVGPEGARRLHQRAASSDKTLRLLSQQWHVLTKEEGWEGLLAEVTAWLVARATNSGSLTKGLGEGEQGPTSAAAAQAGEGSAESREEQEAGRRENAEGEAEGREAAALPGCTGEEGGEAAADAAGTAAAEAKPEAEAEGGGEATGTGPAGGDEAEAEKPERNSAPVLVRSMSMLERMPEHEPLTAPLGTSAEAGGAGGGGGPPLPARRYSFSGRMLRPMAAPGDTTPTAGGSSLLAPLPPLGRRTLPPELGTFGARGRLPPLPPLLDRKPIG
ncbi:hypothetical protein PLESTB_001066600 [Pleodorina starrii]|uniref:Serine aminopeptidase S33 domain-containing protein n=1 Tax=Pleodorina starrii TaxID=330485 RepID=A0A9W6BRB8_9CHLO|nr:hypothetical protein PLESTM_001284400 [Pleodorina starrii]GLC56121.1 hypothetical protein PLESTB_001066600 [Pleodorina starrii]GLC64107.1 hypothetical protein PLESTF_000118800 [Pleodorina starrii]